MWRLLLLAAAFMAPQFAHAQARFTGQMDIYSFEVPAGWTQLEKRDYADVVYAAPGGESQGSFFAGLKFVEHPLSDAMNDAIGYATVRDRRSITIDGLPCETATFTGDNRSASRMLLCHFHVPFSDGDAQVEFFMGGASRAGMEDAHSSVFYQVANSIKWGGTFESAP